MKKLLFLLIITGIIACNSSETNRKTPKKIETFSKNDSILKETLPDTITHENHSTMMDAIFGKPKHNIKSIGILVYNGVNDMDFVGPRHVLAQSGIRPQLIALKSGNVTASNGLEIVPNTVIDSVKQLDILVIPGGAVETLKASHNQKLLNWIKKIDKNSIYTTSVCTGGWILGATGLLKGKKASTNWYREEEFLKKYGAIPANERYTRDGKYWTSAGVTAGMDMSLAILADNWGNTYTQGVMLDMEYDPQPPIEGGSPEKTSYMVNWMMKSMYDAGINPVLDSLEIEEN